MSHHCPNYETAISRLLFVSHLQTASTLKFDPPLKPALFMICVEGGAAIANIDAHSKL